MADPTALNVSRAAKNQALCREVNERIVGLTASLHLELAHRDFICECTDAGCTHVVRLTVAEYEALRGDPTRFLVAPSEDHVASELETVVERFDRYWTVQKVGAGGAIAMKFDPRSR